MVLYEEWTEPPRLSEMLSKKHLHQTTFTLTTTTKMRKNIKNKTNISGDSCNAFDFT